MFRRSFLGLFPAGLASVFTRVDASAVTDVIEATLGEFYRVRIRDNKIIATELISGDNLFCCFYNNKGEFHFTSGPAIVRINQGKKDFSAWAENGKFSHVVYDKKTYEVDRVTITSTGSMVLYCNDAIFGIRPHDGFINFWLL